jgi:hypothetical protein
MSVNILKTALFYNLRSKAGMGRFFGHIGHEAEGLAPPVPVP